MKKAKEDLINNIDQLFNCLSKNRDIKLLSDQREKLNFLIRFINDETIATEELNAIKPFWHKSFKDPLNVSYYIDEIVSLLRDNYNDIKLSNAEKVKPKNIIRLLNERVMTDEEEEKKLYELYEMRLDVINRENQKWKDNKTRQNQKEEIDKIDKELVEINKELAELNKRMATIKNKWHLK